MVNTKNKLYQKVKNQTFTFERESSKELKESSTFSSTSSSSDEVYLVTFRLTGQSITNSAFQFPPLSQLRYCYFFWLYYTLAKLCELMFTQL